MQTTGHDDEKELLVWAGVPYPVSLARVDLRWWRDGLSLHCKAPLRRDPFSLEAETDASGSWGLGGECPEFGPARVPGLL